MHYPKSEVSLSNSASDQNMFSRTYVCMINDVKPNEKLTSDRKSAKGNIDMRDPEAEIADQDDGHIKVLRSRALHELVDTHADDNGTILAKEPKVTNLSQNPTTSNEESGSTNKEDKEEYEYNGNPNIIQLTKIKWLSEGRDGSVDSRSPSLSPASSSTSSQCSQESQSNIRDKSFGDKHLTTILRLDKEHNLFGLSNMAIVGSRISKKPYKKEERAVFHQTAIVQICCGSTCCRNPSNTDLPPSLKCGGGCRQCCYDPCDPYCLTCTSCDNIKQCPALNTTYPRNICRNICSCKVACASSKCVVDCTNCYGLKIAVKRKPVYEPPDIELTPRSSCVLAKPQVARSCHHLPQCLPPSSCFPYLMPCYWPARAGAPCTNPMKCFHNPPCPPPRKPRYKKPPEEICPSKCEDSKHITKCIVPTCPGNNATLRKEIERRFGPKHTVTK